jgi:PAS domain S-box-containing protein
MKRLKSKIILTYLVIITNVLIAGFTGIYFYFNLSNQAAKILKDNTASLEYTENMKNILDSLLLFYTNLSNSDSDMSGKIDNLTYSFDEFLNKALNNITEKGEKDLLQNIKVNFDAFSLNENRYRPEILNLYNSLNHNLTDLYRLNLDAIYRKNSEVKKTTSDALFIMIAIISFASIIFFVIIFTAPGYILKPLNELKIRIKEIAEGKYNQEIEIKSNDEIGELSGTFNFMAEKLNYFEEQHIDNLLTEKLRLEAIIKSGNDGIIILDESGNIVLLNESVRKLLNLPDTLSGRNFKEVINSDTNLKKIGDAIFGDTASMNKIVLQYNDAKAYFQPELINITQTDKNLGYIIILRDITIFENRDTAKTNLIATVSHEFKTPISAINLSLKLLEHLKVGSLNSEQQILIDQIKHQSIRLSKVVNELLSFSESEGEHINFKKEAVSASNVVDLALFTMMLQLNEKKIEYDVTISENLPDISIDLEKTVWVLINLLSNAIRYSKYGDKIIISVNYQGGFVTFSVRDFGPGIDPEDISRIFDKFTKSKEYRRGTGLGLAISKEFIELQGGKIFVESKLGNGSNFSFMLPV